MVCLLVALTATTGAAGDVDCTEWANSTLAEPHEVARECGGSDYVPVFNPKAIARDIGDPAWAHDIGYISDDFITFPLADMTNNTVVSTTGGTYYAMDFDTTATTLYGITDSDAFGAIDLATGAFTSITNITGASSITGLAVDPTDETFYISTATNLYTLNTTTGAATLVGAMGTGGSVVIAIAVNSSGEMYAHDLGDDNIYQINKTTGASTLVGSTGLNANYAQGMDFDLGDDTLYAWIYTGSGAGNFCSVDTTTGAATALSWVDGEWEGAIQVPGGPPRISYVGHDGTDACSSDPANENGVWEPGESIQIPVDVRGSGAFTGVTGALTSTTAGVTIVDGTATWPDLVAGVPTTSNAPHFTVQLAETVPCLDMVNFEVTVNSNEGGPWAYSFSHLIGQALAPVTPVDIPDDGGAANPGISTLTVADDVVITDLNVHVVINHTWVGDLAVALRSPAGTTVMLLDRPGVPGASSVGCSNDNMDVTFDDSAAMTAAALEDHCAGADPWYNGEAQAVDLLSAFNGESTAGVWELEVTDNAGGDTGQIVDWELLTTPAVSGVCNVCVIVQVTADLELVKDAVNNGAGTGTYSLLASNNGPDDATGVVVTDTLPAGVTYVSDDCGGAFVDPVFTWNIGSLLNGASAVCNVLVNIVNPDDTLNDAGISGAVNDPDPRNDSAGAEIPEQMAEAIPTISFGGMLFMVLVLCGVGVFVLRRFV